MTWNRGDDKEPDIIDRKSKDTRRVFVTSSEDDGVTWAKPKEITQDVKLPKWTWYATGPGNGIQLTQGPHAGRLVVPCDCIEAESKDYHSHVILSDDHGKTWRLGGISPQPNVNECTVAELSDGRLVLNMRGDHAQKKNRQICFSKDGGDTWTDQCFDETLIEPVCQASLLRYAQPQDKTKTFLLFSNPASQKRENMTVRLSTDDGKTWAAAKSLHSGPSAYSSLAVLPNGTIGDLYENGEKDAYEKISLAIFPVDSLMKDLQTKKTVPPQ
jgi:sialidase-1